MKNHFELQIPDYVRQHVLDYQLEEFKHAFNAIDLQGATVVEIGGDFHMVSARLFAANGAASVITTSLADSFSQEPRPAQVVCQPVDFSRLPVSPQSVDLVYGVAVLEHLPDIDEIALSIKRILKPTGAAHLHGCPLWSGPDGHHIWLYESQIPGNEWMPCDPSNPLYCFNNSAKNPIPDWAHLTCNHRQLTQLLGERGLPRRHAEAVSGFVFNTNGQATGSASNRTSASEMIERFSQHFNVHVDRILASNPENEFFLHAQERVATEDLRTVGLRLTLRENSDSFA